MNDETARKIAECAETTFYLRRLGHDTVPDQSRFDLVKTMEKNCIDALYADDPDHASALCVWLSITGIFSRQAYRAWALDRIHLDPEEDTWATHPLNQEVAQILTQLYTKNPPRP